MRLLVLLAVATQLGYSKDSILDQQDEYGPGGYGRRFDVAQLAHLDLDNKQKTMEEGDGMRFSSGGGRLDDSIFSENHNSGSPSKGGAAPASIKGGSASTSKQSKGGEGSPSCCQVNHLTNLT